MASLFASTLNTRAICRAPRPLVRSDAPLGLLADELTWLLEHDVTTVVDLRSQAEVEQSPSSLSRLREFDCRHIPISGGNAIPSSPDMVVKSYIGMVDAQMASAVKAIESAPSGALWFCSAGKDRTGVVSAILLHRQGVSRRQIVDDYVASAENLMPQLRALAERRPEVSLEVVTPQSRYMERFLDWYEAHPLP